MLNNAARVASARYIPEVGDILRARLQTVGVEEHRLVLETGNVDFTSVMFYIVIRRPGDPGQEWVFYDVEGCRGQRGKRFVFIHLRLPKLNFDSCLGTLL